MASERSAGKKSVRVAKGTEVKLAERRSPSLEIEGELVGDADSPGAFCVKSPSKRRNLLPSFAE
jgi:hypothetical protein